MAVIVYDIYNALETFIGFLLGARQLLKIMNKNENQCLILNSLKNNRNQGNAY